MVSDIECSKVRLMKEVSSRYSTLVRMVYRTLSTPKVKHKKELTSNYRGWLKESRLRQGSLVRRWLGCEVEVLSSWRVAPGWVRCNWAGHGIFYLSNSSREGKEMSKDCIPSSCTSPLEALKLNQVTRHNTKKVSKLIMIVEARVFKMFSTSYLSRLFLY